MNNNNVISPQQSKSFISALGVDVGSKRIGLAGCDGTGLIATGITTIERRSFVEDVAQIQEIVNQIGRAHV